jgi:hypothetical protein
LIERFFICCNFKTIDRSYHWHGPKYILHYYYILMCKSSPNSGGGAILAHVLGWVKSYSLYLNNWHLFFYLWCSSLPYQNFCLPSATESNATVVDPD